MSNKSNISDAVISLSNIGDKEDENRRNPSEGSHKESPDYLDQELDRVRWAKDKLQEFTRTLVNTSTQWDIYERPMYTRHDDYKSFCQEYLGEPLKDLPKEQPQKQPEKSPKNPPKKSEWAPPITRLGIDIYGDKERVEEIVRFGTESVYVENFTPARANCIEIDDFGEYRAQFILDVPRALGEMQYMAILIPSNGDILDLIRIVQERVILRLEAALKREGKGYSVKTLKHYDTISSLPYYFLDRVCRKKD